MEENPGDLLTCFEGNFPSLKWRDDLLPRNWTWNLKMMVSKRNLLFQGLLFRFHVEFQGCTYSYRLLATPSIVTTTSSSSSLMPCSFRHSGWHHLGRRLRFWGGGWCVSSLGWTVWNVCKRWRCFNFYICVSCCNLVTWCSENSISFGESPKGSWMIADRFRKRLKVGKIYQKWMDLQGCESPSMPETFSKNYPNNPHPVTFTTRILTCWIVRFLQIVDLHLPLLLGEGQTQLESKGDRR